MFSPATKNSGDVSMNSANSAVRPSYHTALDRAFLDLAAIDISSADIINIESVEDTLFGFHVDCCDSRPEHIANKQNGSNINLMDPFVIAEDRRNTWPDIDQGLGQVTKIYNTVRATGLPNSLGAKIPLPSAIRVNNWEPLLSDSHSDYWLLPMLNYGFPLQYHGPAPRPNSVNNHSSAVQYPDHVRKYIAKELSEGALAGPFDTHPFPHSGYVNPIMSRPKGATGDRRIIVDLAYPEGRGINAHVCKNHVFGQPFEHVLPTTHDAIAIAKELDLNVLVAVIDIERAYRNYRSDPIDWPLLVISFDDKYYIDLGLPFGARLSSLYVQRIANVIVATLRSQGILCAMYLDDLFLACHKQADPQLQFSNAMAVLRSLGLPINYKKLVTPTTRAVWLGVYFNFDEFTVSIPHNKVRELLEVIAHIQSCRFISYKQTQSIVGRIAHLARVVPAARIFLARILDQLRASDGNRVYINHAILADLTWFTKYFSAYNATSIIDNGPPVAVIEADSSLAAGGAWCDGRYYIYPYPPGIARAHNICQLETINYLIAVRAFVNNTHSGRTVKIIGDNAGAISALANGRAKDPVLASVSRALWFHCAARDIKIEFVHQPGVSLFGADALSRAVLGETERGVADRFIISKELSPVKVYPAYTNYVKYL